MSKAELGKVEGTNKALDRSYLIVQSNIVLNPRRKQTGLLPALAGLEWAIRHKPNRTSTPEKAEFLPSLDGATGIFLRAGLDPHLGVICPSRLGKYCWSCDGAVSEGFDREPDLH